MMDEPITSTDKFYRRGRILARPKEITPKKQPFGIKKLNLDRRRDGFIYLPPDLDTSKPVPLSVVLHGAGGEAEQAMDIFQPIANASNTILLAPTSRSKQSWDLIVDYFNRDILFINQALSYVFDRFCIDKNAISIGGFSDGASYALSVGILSGDIFSAIIAFSPGFYFAPEPIGKPCIFISHGIQDAVLPINSCSRKIVPKLQNQEYPVTYHEFEGPHIIPMEVIEYAGNWLKGLLR
jgi:phospholipase/carboxylesterase